MMRIVYRGSPLQGRVLAAALSLLVVASCAARVHSSQPTTSPTLLVVDSIIPVRQVGYRTRARIPFQLRNPTAAQVVLDHCQLRPHGLSLERRTEQGWEFFFAPVMPLCGGVPPIHVAPGASYEHQLVLAGCVAPASCDLVWPSEREVTLRVALRLHLAETPVRSTENLPPDRSRTVHSAPFRLQLETEP